MDGLLKDRLLLIDLKLCLEVGDVVREVAAVGAAAGIGEAEFIFHNIIAKGSPIASARSVLLNLLGVGVRVTVLGKETREMLRGRGSAIGKTLVVTVVGLVRASHFGGGGVVWSVVCLGAFGVWW